MIPQTINWLRSARRRQHEAKRSAARIVKLAPLLPKSGVGAELGVFEGLFTRLLVQHLKPSKLHLVDPWFRLSGTWEWAAGNPSTVDAVANLCKTWKPQIERQEIELHIDFDTDVLPRFDDHYFDWVYIDSSHQYEETVKELQILTAKMKPDGVIAGDDWRPDPSHRHHGVCRAVREFVDASDYSLILADEPTAQWALRREG